MSIGISFNDFWQMTVREIKDTSKEYVNLRKIEANNKKSEIYSTALLTSTFIWTLFEGKQVPSIDSIWKMEEIVDEDKITNNDIIATELFKDFVRHHNKGGK